MASYTESIRNIERRIQKAEEQIDQELQPGDVLLVPGETRYFFWDYFDFALSFVATLAIVATLIFTARN